MFEVGFTELLVVFALALVVLGPERLPRLTAKVGRWIGRARTMARQFRDQLEAEANIDPFPSQSQPPHTASTATPPAADAEAARDPAPESPHERGP